MRLIDADDATRVVESVLKKYGLNRESVVTDEIHDAIDNIPTAYDVEKMVEQINENGQKMSEAKLTEVGKGWGHKYYKAISVKKATEIIRKGGVNE